MDYQRDNIRQMTGYAPGEQPSDPAVIKLNTNENPWPPSPGVMACLQSFSGELLRRYPSPTAIDVIEQAAQHHSVATDQIVATNGGDELLRLALTTFVEPGQAIGIAEPSYSLYPVLAAIHNSPVERVELNDDWSLPVDFAEQMNAANVALTFIVNPHAPSGTLLGAERISQLASTLNGVLVVDEAYVNFCDNQQAIVELIGQHDNLLILRTFSKGYSLAGLRLGYGIGAASLIAPIAEKTRDSYSVDALANALGAAALADQSSAQASWEAVRTERAALTEALRNRRMHVPTSHTNFVLAEVPETVGLSAQALYEGLKARGILVRHFATPRLANSLRISIGTPAQNNALLETLDALLAHYT